MSYEGILDQISIGQETELGTAVTPTVSLPVMPSDGVTLEQEAVGVEAIDTTPALNKDFIQGVREYNGAFEMNAYPIAIGYILKSALGAVSVGAVASETLVKEHTFSEAVVKPSLTLEQKISGMTKRFAGFTASGFTISGAVGEAVKFAFTGKALSEADETAITASYETSKVFDWTDIYSITVDGVELKRYINSFSLEYKNGLGNYHGFDSQPDPSALYVENSELSGSFKALFSDDVLDVRDLFKDGTDSEIIITMIGDETIGNGSNNKLVLTMSKSRINTYPTPIDTGYTEVEFEFVCGKDTTNGLIKPVLTNLQLAY